MQIQIRRQLIWIYTVCKHRVHPGSAGQGLKITFSTSITGAAFKGENLHPVLSFKSSPYFRMEAILGINFLDFSWVVRKNNSVLATPLVRAFRSNFSHSLNRCTCISIYLCRYPRHVIKYKWQYVSGTLEENI